MRAAELGAREQRAQERLTAAVEKLAELAGMDATELRVQGRDRQVAALQQRERIADFLEGAVSKLTGSIDAITEHNAVLTEQLADMRSVLSAQQPDARTAEPEPPTDEPPVKGKAKGK